MLACSAAARSSTTSSRTISGSAAAAVAATILQLSSAGVLVAAPLYDNLPGFGGDTQNVFFQAVRGAVEQRAPDLDDIYDENLMTEDLRKFVDAVLDGKLKPEQYQSERLKMNFRRDLDGRVSLRSREGRWYSVRPDMQAVPGFLLLRDPSGGAVFFLPPDEEGDGLAQLDLSDDVVVAELFSNTAWQDVMEPLAVRQPDGSVQQLQLSEREFRSVVSLVEGAEEPELEEEEEGGAEATQGRSGLAAN
ncbi:hypothetical protein VOLCADRAFT_98816 [Volvox carteri f. nagariensis]|uniref:Uncharacterized protein n=1 Tax=Volvox carteri f. nagariensis TaxID=3068 RepID=D8UGC9_VOLCA|nr:uncharacterized protein VOLCADRAFT_98816 [Volvox carteri f. nagariensis]EFJ41268.1 hypothetical protein VOLCADRAFT_98816 [Volvox carteri f. nagariensis]|eukprot:XP_002957719.1 hypothetical protein VOLCADRAFT_98816 [Volvox carteri f. nagariensis]